jgi:hypothetical protein
LPRRRRWARFSAGWRFDAQLRDIFSCVTTIGAAGLLLLRGSWALLLS